MKETNSLRGEIYEKLLHKWLSEKKIAHIRPGMVEDVEKLVFDILTQMVAEKAADRVNAKLQEESHSE